MLDSPLVRRLVALSLEEDLSYGDITATLTVPAGHTSHARIIAREDLVVCGLPLVELIVREGEWEIALSTVAEEGALVGANDVLVQLSGSTRDLLSAERTILNFLQRLCGVATHTRSFCSKAGDLTVLDTRKTMPGWRILDKYSVRVGGGRNHRFSLGDMVLIKNNHIDAHPGGMRGALDAIVAGKPPYMPWEVEVRSLHELEIALEFSPTIVMLDNFSNEMILDALVSVRARQSAPLIEVSGGLTLDRLEFLRGAGVDAISVGSLTTAAKNVDISMRIDKA